MPRRDDAPRDLLLGLLALQNGLVTRETGTNRGLTLGSGFWYADSYHDP